MNNILCRQLKLKKRDTYTIDDLKDIIKTNLGDYFYYKKKSIKYTLLLRKRIIQELQGDTTEE